MNGAKFPEALEELVVLLKGLPGIGRRSAERLALAMLGWHPEKLEALGDLLKELQLRVTLCPQCGNLASEGAICGICANPARDHSIICVVEEPTQIISIEKSSLYKGIYHVLGGKLAPLEGKNAEDLNIELLQKRISDGKVSEIVMALSSDVEGRATAIYLAHLFKDSDVKTTRLASGLPAGSDISYADPETIAAAFSGRTNLD